MSRNETIHIRVNSDVKDNAEKTLDLLGITMSEAINMFLCQVGFTGAIPFEVKLPAPTNVVVTNELELMAKLEKSQKDVSHNKTAPIEEMYSRMEAKYGIQT